MDNFDLLAARLADAHQLNVAYWLAEWDQNVNMPPEGAAARAAHLGTLRRLRHDLLTRDETRTWIERAAAETAELPTDSFAASLVRIARRDSDAAVRIPSAFVGAMTQTLVLARDVWERAKAADNFAQFRPALEGVLDIKRQEADYIGYESNPFDALMGKWEPGLTAAHVGAIFDAQRPVLTALIAALAERPPIADAALHQSFPMELQRQFALFVSERMGFDYRRGRLDISAHPFALQIARDDVRLTTRYAENFFNPAFFGALHEAGHGMHAQGFGRDIDGTFLSDMELSSQAVAESQSRTWENLVGRSRAFWEWAFPHAQRMFAPRFDGMDTDGMYRAVNTARRQFIRVEADESTYNLHIMLRFELENELVNGRLSVADLPDAWNAKFQALFGSTPPSAKMGVLQDIHWSMGGIGAFHGYALGNVLAAQFYAQALAAHPTIPDQIARGQFDTLRGWLTDTIYQHGRKFTADELARRVTGKGIDSADYLAYLQTKFGAIYDL